MLNNEVDTEEVGRRMGLKKTYHLGYRKYAEKFHYIGPGDGYVSEYLDKNVVDL